MEGNVSSPTTIESPRDTARSARRRASVAMAALAAAFVLWGGYGAHWSWTGINGHTATLWDWLHLLLLPAAFALLPILLTRRQHLTSWQKSFALLSLGIFVVLVVIGYVAPWAWTGFTGNRLWDWLELVALPLVVGLTPLLPDIRATWRRHHTLLAVPVLTLLTVAIVGGYLGGWSWTGFQGNTLWDWLHLLLLPLLLPTLVIPALRPMAIERLTPPTAAPSPELDEARDPPRGA